jgi:predicted outer membrane protein
MRHLKFAAGILGIAGLALRLAEDVRLHRLRKRLARVSDETFLKTARSLNAFESSLARLALEKSANEDVRAFADHILEKEGDVTGDLIEIMDMARENDVLSSQSARPGVGDRSPPSRSPSSGVSEKKQDESFKPIYHGWVDDLQNAKAAGFDQTFVDVGQTVYQGAVSVFEAYVRDDATGPLKDYAARNIPRLQARLSQLQGLDLSVLQPVEA